ncbi:MAG: hypothetical protein WC915_06785 [archaeon]|jgi:hypothetical protein
MNNITKKEIIELAKEIAPQTHNKADMIVFYDRTYKHVTNPFQANKRVWVHIEGKCTAQEVLDALWYSCQNEEGCPYTPE